MELKHIVADRIWNICFNLLLDPTVSEVEANGPEGFFIKKSGKRKQLDLAAVSGDDYKRSIREGLVPFVESHMEYVEDEYLYEGPLRFSYGEQKVRGRCHIVLSPASDYAQVTIAKKSTSLATLDDIAARGSMATEMLTFLKMAVQSNLTIVLSGGTGAGKTTMLEALTKLMPSHIRIGVAEDTPELELIQHNVSYLHSVPARPGMAENSTASLSWVVAQFQRMRTDKLIIGETRGKEFADFLIAANSGQDGSMTTIHANDPRKALDKMTNFALKGAPNLPTRAINQDIAQSIDLVIQLIILPDGRHKMATIQEITDTIGTSESASITTQPLYDYDRANDRWVKKQNMTDALRQRIRERGGDPADVSRTQPGAVLLPHGPSYSSGSAASTTGLPRRPERQGY